MKRSTFIKHSAIIGAIIGILPQLSFKTFLQQFSREQLIGKGNPQFYGDGFQLEKNTYEAFLKMKEAASQEGIDIEVVSAYRSFERQKQIFEGKYKRFTNQGFAPLNAIKKIIEYSTIPGTSRHHWGTDIDIIDRNAPRPKSVLESSNFHGEGPFCKLKDWLNKHANRFGFYEVYTNNTTRKGFKYEPWHFSFAAISKPMLQEYKKLDIKKVLQEEKIEGSEFFTNDFISSYKNENILDINPKLL